MNRSKIVAVILLFLMSGIWGCATTEEAGQLKRQVADLQNELHQHKMDADAKLARMTKENDNTTRQIMSVLNSVESRDEKLKSILGKLDELEHQVQVYWNETKGELAALKKGTSIPPKPVKTGESNFETAYREAFEAFQKKSYEEASEKFSGFTRSYGETPLAPNAYFWMGESYMRLNQYDKAILAFQELVDKHPKSDKTPRALLSQAEAFLALKDSKSSTTVLKKIMELFPKTEEAVIAERKLRSLGS
jgi:tol-pal system protein YbgF